MRHIEGLEVYLTHRGVRYDEAIIPEDRSLEHPENQILDGRFHTTISQVSIGKQMHKGAGHELFDLKVQFRSTFIPLGKYCPSLCLHQR